MYNEQLELPFFASRSFEQIMEAAGIENLTIDVRTRMRKSWHVKISSLGRRTLVVPAWMVESPAKIKEAVLEWALLPHVRRRSKKRSVTLQRKRELERIIWAHSETGCSEQKLYRRSNPDRYKNANQGQVYDLKPVFDRVNARFFNNCIAAYLRWGGPLTLTSYQTDKRNTSGDVFHVITIAGVYDHEDVPAFALECVMYHEMLHIAVPPYVKNGRRVIHGPEFKRAEAQHPLVESWKKWEKEKIHTIYMRKKRAVKKHTLKGAYS